MQFLPFFLGNGKLRLWYIIFYILGLPLYLFGIFLLLHLPTHVTFQTRDFILTIFAFGYFLLGLVSLINTLLYAKAAHNYFKAFFIFLGIQILFWMIGNMLGNNYMLLSIYFLLFLLLVIFMNLKALSRVAKTQVQKYIHHHTQ